MKKLLSTVLTAVVLMACSMTAFAAEMENAENGAAPNPEEIFSERISFSLGAEDAAVLNGEKMSARGWPGQGPAPQVTSVNMEAVGILKVPGHEGNVGVIVKVMGYGRDYAKYDNTAVNYFQSDPFIISGTLVDGFYYYYDCGAPTLGNHRFDIKMISTNPPHSERSAWATFTINQQ